MERAPGGARADVSLYELPLLGNAGSGKPSDDFRVDSSAGGAIPVQADAIRLQVRPQAGLGRRQGLSDAPPP